MILGTGGTIAGSGGEAGATLGYTAGTVPVADLLAGITAPDGIRLEAEQIAQLDSKDMDLATWLKLRERCAHWLAKADVVAVIITHGTDTIEETSFFLESTIPSIKPIVLTCAMRPASALSPDGPQNLRDAVSVATAPGATGVTVVCAGEVHEARYVTKSHPYGLNAFSSGDAGPVGYVEENEVRRVRPWPKTPTDVPDVESDAWREPHRWPRVEILLSHAGASGTLLETLVEQRRLGLTGAVDGVVLAATGNGSLHVSLENAAASAAQAGRKVLIASRCGSGKVLRPGANPIPDAGELTPTKARIQLMLSLLA